MEKEVKEKKPVNKKKVAVIVLIIVVILAVGGYVLYNVVSSGYYSRMTYEQRGADGNLLNEEDAGKLTGEWDDGSLENSDEDEIARLERELEANAERLNALNPISSDSVYNILLIGVDSRSIDERGRSDAMMIVSINAEQEKIYVTSFLRDIYVSIPGIGNNRLNAAYVYGGASLLIDTIEQNFGVKIDKYMKTNFFSFIDIIDAVGTVDLEVTAEEINYMNRYIREENQLMGVDKNDGTLNESQAGLISMNGKQALAYSRLRYIGTDFARTERQRKVIMEIAKQIKKMSKGERVALLNDAMPNIVTDITEDEFKAMILKSSEYMSYQIKCMCVPVSKSWSYVTMKGMSVIGIDFDKNIKAIRDWIYGEK